MEPDDGVEGDGACILINALHYELTEENGGCQDPV
jgi:hypothetical protein